jgi:hypothetical protein
VLRRLAILVPLLLVFWLILMRFVHRSLRLTP